MNKITKHWKAAAVVALFLLAAVAGVYFPRQAATFTSQRAGGGPAPFWYKLVPKDGSPNPAVEAQNDGDIAVSGGGNITVTNGAWIGYLTDAAATIYSTGGITQSVEGGGCVYYAAQSSDIAPRIKCGYSGNQVGGAGSIVAGGGELGDINRATSGWNFVGGGGGNYANQTYSLVAGGFRNEAGGSYAAVGGGVLNSATDSEATVAGGRSNSASQEAAFVGGGEGNSATNEHAMVGGGNGNLASGRYSSVLGGRNNDATGDRSAVGGGQGNTASGNDSTVVGGAANVSSGRYSVASGADAAASNTGEWAHSAGEMYSTGDAQAALFVGRILANHSSATTYTVALDGSSESISLPSDSIRSVEVYLVGAAYVSSERWAYRLTCVADNYGGTSALLVGTTTVLYEDDAAYNAACVVDDATDTLKIQVWRGAGASWTGYVQWVAAVYGVKLKYL